MRRILFALMLTIVRHLEAGAQDDPEDAFKFARNLFQDAGDFATAAELFGEFIRNFPRSERLAEARLMHARALKNGGRCDLAIKAYEDFYLTHGEHLETAATRTERARCLHQRKRYLEAAQAFEEVQVRFSESEYAATVLLDAANNYNLGSKEGQAGRVYRKLISEYPDDAAAQTARYRLAELDVALGNTERALASLEEISTADPSPQLAPSALLFAGRLHLFKGELQAAESIFAQLKLEFPQSTQADSAALQRAVYLLEHGFFSAAAEAYEVTIKKVGDPRLARQAALGLADAQRLSGNPQLAVGQYRVLLEDREIPAEEIPRIKLGLGVALGLAGETNNAVALFHEVMDSAPTSAAGLECLRELGALYQRLEDYRRSVIWYQRYLDLGSATADQNAIRLELARVLLKIQLYEEAIRIFSKLMENGAPEPHLGLAEALEYSGQKNRALAEYVAFVEQHSDHVLAATAHNRATYLRNFSVMDPDRRVRILQQAWLDELNGTPREIVQLDVAQALFELHDFPHAVRTLETYVATYPQSSYAPKAQYLLAKGLIQLSRQRRLEGEPAMADSLERLALQEFRILSGTGGDWAHRAEIGRLELEAAAASDSARFALLEDGYSALLERDGGEPALLGLAEARRQSNDREKLDLALADYRRFVDEYPESPMRSNGLYGLGLALIQKGQYSAAIDTLEELLRIDLDSPLTPSVLFEIGHLLRREGKPEDAAARYRELLWSFPSFPQRRQVQLNLADIHFDLAEFGLALRLYRQSARSVETDDAVWRQIARCHRQRGEAKEALAILQTVAANEPDAADLDSLYFAAAELLADLGRKQEAAHQYHELSRELPESTLALPAALRSADLYFELDQYATAHPIYLPHLAKVANERPHARAALSLFRASKTDAAREAFKRFRKRFGKKSSWLQLFQLEEGQYLLSNDAFEPALKIFREVAKGDGPWASEASYFEATTLWQQHQEVPTEESGPFALSSQARFIEKHPESPRVYEVHRRLGHYHFGVRSYLLAAAAYKRILHGDASDALKAEAIWRLLECYSRAYEYDEAHRMALRLLHEFPDHPQTQYVQLRIGIILMEKGQYAQAIAQLRDVLQWATGNDASEARFYIGESYRNMGEYRKAIEAYYRVSFHGADGFSQWISSADFKRAECHEQLNELATAESVYLRIVQREGADSPQGAIAKKQIALLRQRAQN